MSFVKLLNCIAVGVTPGRALSGFVLFVVILVFNLFCLFQRVLRACGFFRARVSSCLFSVFSIFSVFVPRSGSGARGLIKAPAGDRGLAPGSGSDWFVVGGPNPFGPPAPPDLMGGIGGVPHKSLLDLLVRTDTKPGVGRGSRGLLAHCSFCPHEGQDLGCSRCGHHLLFCDCD